MTDYQFGDTTNWIDGRWTEGAGGERRDALNPAPGRSIGTIVWSSPRDAFRFIEELPADIVNVNAPNSHREIQIPFGRKTGKDSGIGRVGGKHTLLAMTDIKTACINIG